MRVIVRTHRSPEKIFLVVLPEKKLADRVVGLINKGKRSDAIDAALSRGKVLRHIAKESDLVRLKADLILTEENARYDLV